VLVHEERQEQHALRLGGIATEISTHPIEMPAVLLKLVHPALAVGAVGKGRGQLEMDTGARRLLKALWADGRLIDRRMRLLHGLGWKTHRVGAGPERAAVGELLLGARS